MPSFAPTPPPSPVAPRIVRRRTTSPRRLPPLPPPAPPTNPHPSTTPFVPSLGPTPAADVAIRFTIAADFGTAQWLAMRRSLRGMHRLLSRELRPAGPPVGFRLVSLLGHTVVFHLGEADAEAFSAAELRAAIMTLRHRSRNTLCLWALN